ncbi:MAG TPA: oligosaccharide flippase family protein [Xanthobacteraceae bacterium]
MALTDSERGTSLRGIAKVPSRLRAWLADHSDRSIAQRMAGTAFLIRIASAVLAYGSQVLLARWMGSYEFGIYVYVLTWILVIGGLADLGLACSAQRFIPEYLQQKGFALLRGFLSGSRWMTFGIATVVAALAALTIALFRGSLDHYVEIPLYLACATLPLYALMQAQDGIARSFNWINLALMPLYVIRQLLFICLVTSAYLAGYTIDAVTVTGLAGVSMWITGLGQLFYLNRRLRAEVPAGRKTYAPGTWLLVSTPMFLVEAFHLLLSNVDILLLKQFRTPDEVAVYYAAAKTLALVAFIYFSVSAAIAHKFTEYHLAGDREGLADFLADTVRWTFWPSLAATIVLLAFGKLFLLAFGTRFTEGYSVMFILAVGLLARSAVGPVERLLNMLDEQRICATVYAVAVAANLILCCLLIPPHGIEGAAVSTSAAFLLESVLLFWVTKRRLGLHVFIFRRRAKKG